MSGSAPGRDHPNAVRIRDLQAEASRRGDNSHLLELVSEHAVNHVDGNSLLGGHHVGRDEALGKFPILHQMSGGTLNLEPLEVIADDHFAMWLSRVTAQRNGRQLDQVLAVIWRFDGEKVVEMWDHFADVDAWDEFWKEES